MKIIIASFISALLASSATYYWLAGEGFDDKGDREVIEAEVDGDVSNASGQQTSDVSVYVAQIQQLEARNRELTQALKNQGANSKLVDKVSGVEQEGIKPDVDLDAFYAARKNSDELSEYLTSGAATTAEGLSQDMAAKFDAEPQDPAWARNYQQQVEELFFSDPRLRDFTPQSVACKSKRCQINVAVADPDQANKLMESFSAAVGSNNLSIKNSMVVSTPDFEKGMVSLYIGRDENVKLHE